MNKKSIVLTFFIIIFSIIILLLGINISNNQMQNNSNIYNINIDNSKLNIFYFYVGQADCTLIISDNETMLIDAGNKSDANLIIGFLEELGINQIDYIIGTHPDNDHIGGIATILKEFEVKHLCMPNRVADNTAYNDIIQVIETSETDLTIENVVQNEIINLGNAECIVKWVDNDNTETDNNSSIVLELNYGSKKYLFMGDIESDLEKKLIQQNVFEEIDILKVAHHGSNSSTSEEFLKVINPKYAIISSGSNYNLFPNEECLKRLLNFINADNIYITERDGTIWNKFSFLFQNYCKV